MSAAIRVCPEGCHASEVGYGGRAVAGVCKLAKSRKEGGYTVYEPSPDCRLIEGPMPARKATATDAWGEP